MGKIARDGVGAKRGTRAILPTVNLRDTNRVGKFALPRCLNRYTVQAILPTLGHHASDYRNGLLRYREARRP